MTLNNPQTRTSLVTIILFAVIVTLAMNALDLAYHVAIETAIHLNYVLVKFTIIAYAVLLVAWLSGISLRNGIFTSLLGPIAFWIYYQKAYPTIPREVFIVDENLGYIIIHAFALFVAYFLTYRFVLKKSEPEFKPTKCYLAWGFVAALMSIVYSFIPQLTLKNAGIHLELPQIGTSLLGLTFLPFAVVLLLKILGAGEKSSKPLSSALLSTVVSLATITMVLGLLMVLKINVVEDYGEIFFTNAPFVFSILLLSTVSIFSVHFFLGRSMGWGILAALLLGLQNGFFISMTGISSMEYTSLLIPPLTLLFVYWIVLKLSSFHEYQ